MKISSTHYFIRFVMTGLCILPATLAAQETATATAAETPNYYQVELIVFRHLDQSRTTGEIPRMPEPEMAELLEQDLARLSGSLPSTPAINESGPEANNLTNDAADVMPPEEPLWLPVNADSLLLGDTAARLDKLEPYEIVSYLRWAQTAEDVTAAKSIDLTDLGADSTQLIGSVELHQRRYLHLVIDVALATGSANEMTSNYSDDFQFFDSPEALPALKDSRRIRLEQMHYFDQPKFGVIAMVSRFELPAEAETAQTTGGLAN